MVSSLICTIMLQLKQTVHYDVELK